MNRTEITTQVQRILADELPDFRLGQEGLADLDSVQKLTLVVAIEDHFELCFDPEREDSLETLDDVISYLHEQLNLS